MFANNAMANFAADDVDVGIRFGERAVAAARRARRVLEDECFPVASPKFNRGRLPKSAKELLGMRIIREDRDYWKEWFEAAGVAVEGAARRPVVQRRELLAAVGDARRGRGAHAPLARRRRHRAGARWCSSSRSR